MALTQISTQGIKDGTITGTDLATNVDLVDNQKLRLGTGNDLQIYHNGSHSYIDDAGTGNLYIRSSQLVLQNAAGDEDLAILTSNGAVKLYFNDSKKFETTSGGVQVTDNLNMSGGHIFLADNYKLNVGTGDDLQIYHDGSDSYINDTGTGDLNIRGSIVRAQASNGDTLFRGVEDGAVELYYDNSKKFETFANGIKLYDTQGDLIGEGFDGGFNFTSSVMVNELRLQDNEKIKVGLGEDLQIYHLSSGGGDSYITNSNGNLNIVNSTDGWIRLQPKSGEEGVIVKYDGAVELYHDNVVRLTTSTTGLTIGGGIVTTHHCTFGGHLLADTANIRDIGSSSKPFNDAFLNGITMLDNKKIALGNSADLQIYHDGTHSYIANSTNNLYVNAPNFFHLGVSNGGEKYLTATENGAVELYYDNSKKLETNSTGIHIFGNTGHADGAADLYGSGNDLRIYHDGTNSYIQNFTGALRVYNHVLDVRNDTGNEKILVGNANGSVELYHNNSKQFETTSTGSTTFGTHHSTSDIALKTNIKPITNTLEKIQQITGYKYKFIKSNENSIGVVAQEVEKVFPELVAGTEGNKTLQYNGLIGVLIEAVKELSAEVAALKAA